MEYAEGETLSDFLNRKGVLTEAELKAILHPILDGLEVVHRADFLHRDIKPGNIIIRAEDDSPVLLDFGAARLAIGAKSRSITSVVTPGYAPREQYSSRGNQGPWTDIYALGGVCYRALTAEVPTDAVDRMIDDPLIPVSERCKGHASHQFLAAIDHALQVDESDRPQSASEWRAELGDADDDGSTPLHGAACENAHETAEVLLKYGADVNAMDDDGSTPLHDAAVQNAHETAEVLLKYGADVNAMDDNGFTPLHRAAYENARETAEVLLKHGADVNAMDDNGWTPLHYAAVQNAHETAEVLLKHGADVNAMDDDGTTPLHRAVQENAHETAALLRRYGGRE